MTKRVFLHSGINLIRDIIQRQKKRLFSFFFVKKLKRNKQKTIIGFEKKYNQVAVK